MSDQTRQAAMQPPEWQRVVGRHPLLAFSLLVVVTPYAVLVPLLWLGVDPAALRPLKLLFAVSPLVFGCLAAFCSAGSRGVEQLLARLWVRPATRLSFPLALSVFPAVALAALYIRYATDGFFPPREEFASWSTIAALSLPLLLFPGITEEFAWRGWLQSGLQRRWGWWLASLVVGVVWGSWHGFDFLLGNWTFSWNTFWGYPLFIVSNAIIIGWIYKISGESVAAAILAHFGSNCVNFFMPVFEEYRGSALPAVLYIGGLCGLALMLPFGDAVLRVVRRQR